jgi:Lipopolysaccharide-assembly
VQLDRSLRGVPARWAGRPASARMTGLRNAALCLVHLKIRNFKFYVLRNGISSRVFFLNCFRVFPLCLCVSTAILLSACGYRVAGTSTRLPAGLKVIAVPTFENRTNRYRIEQVMTEALVHEFLARTRYRVVSSEDGGDAVLHAEIDSFDATPVVFDTTPGPNSTPVPNVNATTTTATAMLISLRMKVLLEDRQTKQVLYKNDNYLFREPYELSTDPKTFFDEQGPAMGRLSRDFASRLVADIVENF